MTSATCPRPSAISPLTNSKLIDVFGRSFGINLSEVVKIANQLVLGWCVAKKFYSGPYKQDSLPVLLMTNVSVLKKKVVCAVPAILPSRAGNGFKYLSTLICYKYECVSAWKTWQSFQCTVYYSTDIDRTVSYLYHHKWTVSRTARHLYRCERTVWFTNYFDSRFPCVAMAIVIHILGFLRGCTRVMLPYPVQRAW